ncbi:hypothetical protein CGRA01v4_01817 [Colletotrichum graminicola]|nr:hypothetical protein CGRA01v4_01817 [Colletotrichum graminicola]
MRCLLSLTRIQQPMLASSHEIDLRVKNCIMHQVLVGNFTLQMIPSPAMAPRSTMLTHWHFYHSRRTTMGTVESRRPRWTIGI